MSKMIINRNQNLSPKLKAFEYQEEAYEFIKDMDYAAVFHEQGLGKTKIAIDVLLYWLEEKSIDTVLIVTKKQLIHNWEEEFRIHTSIKPRVLTNNRSNNYYVFNSATRVIITNFETISTEKERMKLFLKSRDIGIIIDESAKLKNPNSKLTKDFFELSTLFKKRVIMTGTPVANRPFDIWAQIYFLDNGKSLGDNYEVFERNANLSNDLSNNIEKKDAFESFISEIFEKIKDFSIRETKDSGKVILPEREYINIWANFEKEQYELYSKLRSEMQIEVKKGDKTILDDSSASLKRLLRLVQITSNPKLVDENFSGKSAKEKELDFLLKDIVGRGEKCIVWSSFIENVDYFNKKYQKYNAVKIHGGMSIENRNKSVDKFKKGDAKVLFATPQSAKEGLTLTVANNVVFYDRGFSLDDYLQAQDRIHRISQKKTCHIYNIMIKGSIDEWIDSLLLAKQNAAKLSQGDITLEEYRRKIDYSYGDMIKDILELEEQNGR